MNNPDSQPLALGQFAPPTAKPRRTLPAIPTIIIGVAAALAFCVAGCAGKTAAGAPAPAASTITPTVTAPAPAASPAVAPPASTTIQEGTWTVGTDFPAGTYRTTGSGSDCYWMITKSGSNGADIIQNQIGGGNLTVSLKSGQDFTSQRCGSWAKVG
jgi:hypothetical protein